MRTHPTKKKKIAPNTENWDNRKYADKKTQGFAEETVERKNDQK